MIHVRGYEKMVSMGHSGSHRGGQSSRTPSTAPQMRPALALKDINTNVASSASSQLAKKYKLEDGRRSGSITPAGSEQSDPSPSRVKGRGATSSAGGIGSLSSWAMVNGVESVASYPVAGASIARLSSIGSVAGGVLA